MPGPCVRLVLPHVGACRPIQVHVALCCRVPPHVASCCLMFPHVCGSLSASISWPFERRFGEQGKVRPNKWLQEVLQPKASTAMKIWRLGCSKRHSLVAHLPLRAPRPICAAGFIQASNEAEFGLGPLGTWSVAILGKWLPGASAQVCATPGVFSNFCTGRVLRRFPGVLRGFHTGAPPRGCFKTLPVQECCTPHAAPGVVQNYYTGAQHQCVIGILHRCAAPPAR